MSNSVWPYRRQPTRLHCPLDSPGKNTGVVCHFLLQCMQVKSESEVTQSCLTLCDPMTAAYQAPPTMGFSRQEYWSGVPLPSPNHVLSVSKLIKEGMTLAPHNLTSKFVIYRHFFWVLYFMAISVTREFIFWKMFVHRNPYVPHRHGVLCNIRKMWKQPKLKWRGKSALPWRHLLAVDK